MGVYHYVEKERHQALCSLDEACGLQKLHKTLKQVLLIIKNEIATGNLLLYRGVRVAGYNSTASRLDHEFNGSHDKDLAKEVTANERRF